MVKSILIQNRDNGVVRDKRSHVYGIAFSHATIYEFPMILGDNPAVSNGTPVTIDWKHQSEDIVDLDFLEFSKNGRRRSRKQLIMKSSKRDMYLLGIGHTIEHLVASAEECQKIRDSRLANMKLNDRWATKLMYGIGNVAVKQTETAAGLMLGIGNAAMKTGNAAVKVLRLPGSTKTAQRTAAAKSA